jgi:GMP synthase-like glutamine amidotransferase
MSHCLILQHDDAFGPGRVVPTFRDFGIPTVVRHVAQDGPPDDLDEVRVLVLLGGTQRLTTGDELADEYGPSPSWLGDEVEAIKPMVDQDRPVLAFGLGAQILAKAAGAAVRPLTRGAGDDEAADPHLGWDTIRLPFPGGTDPILFGLSDGTPMFFWQKDGFDLPKLPLPEEHDPDKKGPPPPTGNLLLSSTSFDKNAGFRFKKKLTGLAYHPELERQDLDKIIRDRGGAVGAALGSDAIDRLRSETDRHYDRYSRLGERLLKNFVQYLHAYDSPTA